MPWRWSLLICVSLWGLWGFLGKLAAVRMSWAMAALLTALGGVVGLGLAGPWLVGRLHWPGVEGLGVAVACGAAGGIGGLFYMQAMQQGPASLVVPLSQVYLVITVMLAVVFLGESLTLRKLLGLGLMMAGAALLAREGM